MEAIKLLGNYKKILDRELQKYFKEKLGEAQKNNPLTKEAIKMIAEFALAGGKRIRPALVYYAYLACGGKDKEKIIEASMSIELTHIFLLIHDDIIDKDEKRHGVATLHERYKKIGERFSKNKDSAHFGNSMALLAGDMAAAMANQIIFKSDFPPEIIIRALNKLQEIVYAIVPGEMMDVVIEIKGKTTEKEVLEMYEGKTSSYSFEGPLHLGAVLAGSEDKNVLDVYSRYAYPLGKAFQIQDDILGLFGNEKKIGKPVGSDVKEGKQTLLVIKAQELGNEKQKEAISRYLGKKDLNEEELEKFRSAIRETGALDCCKRLAKDFILESLGALEKIEFKNDEAKLFLEGIAGYMLEREV